MGEAKRRKQLDLNWGKRSLISVTVKTCKEVFRPRTNEGESLLHWGIVNFYRTALENDAPGITMLDCSKDIGTDSLPGFTGLPVFMGSRFISLDEMVDIEIPKLPIERIRHLAEETNFSEARITMIRFSIGGDASDLLAVVPVAAIMEDLSAVSTGSP